MTRRPLIAWTLVVFTAGVFAGLWRAPISHAKPRMHEHKVKNASGRPARALSIHLDPAR